MSNWQNNKMQFPRLIMELNAAGAFTEEIMTALQASMDLTGPEIQELIARAELSFELLKSNADAGISLDPTPLCPTCGGTKMVEGKPEEGHEREFNSCPTCCELPKLEDIKLPGDDDE